MHHEGIGLVQREIPELKKASFTGMEKYRSRKLLRGLLSFPVHMRMHYVLATVWDQNLSFRNSLSCVLGKGEGCMVYLCVLGVEGLERECWEEPFRCSLELDCFFGPHNYQNWAGSLSSWSGLRELVSPELAPKRSRVYSLDNTGQFCMFTLDGWFCAHLFFRCTSWDLALPSTNIYQSTTSWKTLF